MTLLLILGTFVTGFATLRSLKNSRIGPESAIFALIVVALTVSATIASFVEGVEITRGSAAQFSINEKQAEHSGWILLGCAVLFLASSLIFNIFARQHPQLRRQTAKYKIRKPFIEEILGRNAVRASITAIVIYALLIFPTVGEKVIHRDSYLFLTSGSIGALLATGSLPIGLVAATLFSSSHQRINRVASLMVLLLILIFELSKASRAAAGLILFSGLIYFVLSQSSLLKRLLILLSCFATGAVLLVSVIQLRGSNTGHGLVPYWQLFVSNELSFAPERWNSAFLNLMATIPITYLSSQQVVPEGLAFTSLNPLPGKMVGWYDIASDLNLFPAVPSNAFGQIAAMNFLEGGVCIVIISGLISGCAVIRSYAPYRLHLPLIFVSSTLTILASILFMQYSLRSGSRWLWLALCVTAVTVALAKTLQRPVQRYAPIARKCDAISAGRAS